MYEDGKAPGEPLGRLQARVNLPSDWRFVLVRTSESPGLAGSDERRTFELVRSTPVSTATQLRKLAEDIILPAARSGTFEQFASGIADYNRLAGSCFALVQQGNFASAEIAELVTLLQQRGIRGAGQSSWGPTVFAILPDEPAARKLATWLVQDRGYDANRVTITSAIEAHEALSG
jgi:predicted sugar kinase